MAHRESLASRVMLRPVAPADLEFLYQMQTDPRACALSMVRPRTREAFFEVWEGKDGVGGVFRTPRIVPRAIVLRPEGGAGGGAEGGAGELVGCINLFLRDDQEWIGYAVARPVWGRGIASRALGLLLAELPPTRRPLHARAAVSNSASVRTLLRNGFEMTGTCFSPESADGRFLACEEASFILR